MTVYLDADTLIRINARQDGGVGVRDRDGVESAAHRPAAAAFGEEKFPTVWLKAAAYAHGIASTQHFYDGNKRTAWLAAQLFLDANGHELPPVPDIQAEFFINAVALDAWRADGDTTTIAKAAEWFENVFTQRSRRGPERDPRVQFAVITSSDAHAADALWSASGINAYRIVTTVLPASPEFSVVVRVLWDAQDVRKTHTITVAISPEDGSDARPVRRREQSMRVVTAPSGHRHHTSGVMPTISALLMKPKFRDAGDYWVDVLIDGSLAARLPFAITHMPGADLANLSWGIA